MVSDADVEVIGDKTYHVFKCSVAPKEMASTIYAQIVTSSGSGIRWSYSVKEYADYILDNAYAEDGTVKDEALAEAVPVVRSMLWYGSCAQRSFGEGAAFDAADPDEGSVPEIDTTVTYPEEAITSGDSKLSYYGSSLILRTQTVQRHYFKVDDDIDMFSFTIGGKEVTPVQHQDAPAYWYIDSAPLSAEDLGTQLTVTADPKNGGDGMTFLFCPMDHVKTVLGMSPAPAETAVCRALYFYHKAVAAYAELRRT